jgi:hypothetical protein
MRVERDVDKRLDGAYRMRRHTFVSTTKQLWAAATGDGGIATVDGIAWTGTLAVAAVVD